MWELLPKLASKFAINGAMYWEYVNVEYKKSLIYRKPKHNRINSIIDHSILSNQTRSDRIRSNKSKSNQIKSNAFIEKPNYSSVYYKRDFFTINRVGIKHRLGIEMRSFKCVQPQWSKGFS